MAKCTWCGEVRADMQENGPVRLCSLCSKGERPEWQLAPTRVNEFEDEFQPRVAGWIRVTALVLLLAFLLPVLSLFWPL